MLSPNLDNEQGIEESAFWPADTLRFMYVFISVKDLLSSSSSVSQCKSKSAQSWHACRDFQ